MEKFKILEIDVYRDGGTISIDTNQGQYCINCGMGRTENVDRLFHSHPSLGKLLPDDEAKLVKRKIKTALKTFTGLIAPYQVEKINNIKIK